MTHTRITQTFKKVAVRVIKPSRVMALAIIAAFATVAMQPAQAQSSDTWKSVAIIGGSTAAGAYIGHKIGGSTGALVGAGVGATVGYQIDRRRRQNNYYNEYGDNNGYYGNDPYGNGGYSGGPYDGGYPYPSGFQSNNYSGTSSHYARRR